MKKLQYPILFSTIGFIGTHAQNSLTVNITNIITKTGNIEIGLHNKEKGFLKDGAQFMKKKLKVSGKTVNYTFENLPKGNYAIAIYHDANQNNKCDTNLIGIPTEGFGFSNNFRPTIAAPNFNQTKIFLDNNKTIFINLIH